MPPSKTTLLSQTRDVSHRAFRDLNTFRRRVRAYLRPYLGETPFVERIIRQGPAYSLGLKRSILIPRRALDIESLATWKRHQAVRRASLRSTLDPIQNTQVNLSTDTFSNASRSPQCDLIDLSQISHFEAGQIYILNSNDINKIGRKRYAELYMSSPDAFITVWDFDNHHALTTSFLLATFSDLYIPCHAQNLSLIAQFTDALAAPVPAGVNQWSRSFLRDHQGLIINEDRNPSPLGRHIVYPHFRARNWTLAKLSGQFADVGAVNTTYHDKTERDRLEEWCAHMSHWILPTFNDIPIRVFDALVTGGVPIVPRTLRQMPELSNIRDSMFFFDADDLETPSRITEAANDFFQQQGREGIEARHHQAMQTEHVDARVQAILKSIEDELSA